MTLSFSARVLIQAFVLALGLCCAQPGRTENSIPAGLENATKEERVRYAADLERQQREKSDRLRQAKREQILEALPGYVEQGLAARPESVPETSLFASADDASAEDESSQGWSLLFCSCLGVLVAVGLSPKVRASVQDHLYRRSLAKAAKIAGRRYPRQDRSSGDLSLSLGNVGRGAVTDSPGLDDSFEASSRQPTTLPAGESLFWSGSPEQAGSNPISAKPSAADARAMPVSSLAKSLCVEGELDAKTLSVLAREFCLRAPGYIDSLERILFEILESSEDEARLALLADFYLRVHSLTCTAERAGLRPAHKLAATTEAMAKRLFEDPKHATAFAVGTLSSAIEVLKNLCVPGLPGDLAQEPAVRLLVVDDDLLSRRAMACALQMAFDKPDSADGGKAALALATEQAYEVIFLDVDMPEMDGFTLCPRIHEQAANGQTPVIFVTSRSDTASRNQAISCGGSDLLAKPFLLIELTLKALTFALQNRLQKRKKAAESQEPSPAHCT